MGSCPIRACIVALCRLDAALDLFHESLHMDRRRKDVSHTSDANVFLLVLKEYLRDLGFFFGHLLDRRVTDVVPRDQLVVESRETHDQPIARNGNLEAFAVALDEKPDAEPDKEDPGYRRQCADPVPCRRC